MMGTTATASRVELRPYQREAVDACHETDVQNPAIGLPTGTGKTLVFSKLIEERGHPALILAHRDELIQQAVEKYHAVDPTVPVGIVKAGLDQSELPVVVGSVQTLARKARLDRMPLDFRTIVVDEAHHAAADTYRRILDHFSHVEQRLFVSATLERADKKALGSVIDKIVYHRSLIEMMEDGYLCDVVAKAIRVPSFNVGQLKIVRGDFQAGDVQEALIAAHAERVAVSAWMEHASDRKTIVFTPGVASAILFAEAFKHAGVAATYVSGDLDIEDRRERLEGFAKDEYQVVTNAMVLTEGYDEPSVSCIVVARPTRSKPLYIQQIGRGTRLYPGKQDLLVLDLVGNEERLDLISVPKLFGIDPDKAENDGVLTGVKKTKEEAEAERQRMIALGHSRAGLGKVGVTSHDARLLDRKDINWLRLQTGEWVLSGKRGTIVLRPLDGRTWEGYVRVHADDRIIHLSTGHDLAMSMGIAEEKVVRKAKSDTRMFIDKSAPWRQRPVSPKQRNLLAKWRIPVTDGMLAGEASDLIDAYNATQRR